MTLKLITEKVKQLKAFLLENVQNIIEPVFWEEFLATLDLEGSGNYHILDHDLPIIRDLKAFLNMLTAVERATEKLTDKYALMVISVVKKLELIQDILDFHRNYKIYISTNSILTQYLSYAKEIALTTVLPQLIEKLAELSKLCTSANIEKVAEIFIEEIILLEKYQDNYLQRKKNPPKEIELDKKEDFVSVVIKQNDVFLRKIYKDQYDTHFKNGQKIELKSEKSEKKLEIKSENNSDNDYVYYPENKKDSDTIKNIKLLLNGIIGIKKVLDDHTGYQKANMISSVKWMATFVMHSKDAYERFQEFDYQAIIAEKAKPFTDEIKKQLTLLNDLLEELACIADRFENEFRLKQGILLKQVKLLIDRHNQITCELRIPTDYVKQKNIYYQSRMRARESYLTEIDVQLKKLKQFIIYKDYALMDIPYYVIKSMQDYIKKYEDAICMDHSHLATYKTYLSEALDVRRGFKSFVMSQLEYIANLSGLTMHYELMKTLHDRMLYLQRQKIFLKERFQQSTEYFNNHPYGYLKLSDINELGHQGAILKALKTHAAALSSENESLLAKTGLKKDIVQPLEQKSKPVEDKVNPVEEKPKLEISKSELIKSETIKPRLENQIKLKTKELSIFTLTVKKYEETKTFEPPLNVLNKEESLTPQSIILLQEISDVLRVREEKSIKLA